MRTPIRICNQSLSLVANRGLSLALKVCFLLSFPVFVFAQNNMGKPAENMQRNDPQALRNAIEEMFEKPSVYLYFVPSQNPILRESFQACVKQQRVFYMSRIEHQKNQELEKNKFSKSRTQEVLENPVYGVSGKLWAFREAWSQCHVRWTIFLLHTGYDGNWSLGKVKEFFEDKTDLYFRAAALILKGTVNDYARNLSSIITDDGRVLDSVIDSVTDTLGSRVLLGQADRDQVKRDSRNLTRQISGAVVQKNLNDLQDGLDKNRDAVRGIFSLIMSVRSSRGDDVASMLGCNLSKNSSLSTVDEILQYCP